LCFLLNGAILTGGVAYYELEKLHLVNRLMPTVE